MKQTNEVDLSISIVNHNGASLLEGCLASIFSQPPSPFTFEVFVADNESTDDSEMMVAKKYPQVTWLQTGGDKGYGFAHNLSAKHARGRILYLNANDTKMPPDFFQKIYVETNGLKFDGFLVYKQRTFSDQEALAHFGVDILGFPCLSSKASDRFYSEGSNYMVDRESFLRMGGYDSDLYLFYEDIDLFWRARILGIPITFNENIFVYHKGGATVSGGHFRGEEQYKTTSLRRYLNERNAIRNMIKNYSMPYLLPILSLYVFLSLSEMVFLAAISRNFRVIKSYIGAWFWNVYHLPNTLVFRRTVQTARKVTDQEIVKLMYRGYGKLLTVKKIGLPRII